MRFEAAVLVAIGFYIIDCTANGQWSLPSDDVTWGNVQSIPAIKQHKPTRLHLKLQLSTSTGVGYTEALKS